VSGRVRRGRFFAGSCSTKSVYCRYVFGEVVLVSGHVRRGRLMSGRDRRGRVIVGMCSANSAFCRALISEVLLASGLFRRGLDSVEM